MPNDTCDPSPTLTDVGGISFYEGSNYPAEYKNSLFFADPIRGCIYVMKASPDGEPDPASVSTFEDGKSAFSFPGTDIEQGPEGDIFYTEFDSGPGTGTVHRITYTPNAHEREEQETREREGQVVHEREEAEAHQREEAHKLDETSQPGTQGTTSSGPASTPTPMPPPTYGPPKSSTAIQRRRPETRLPSSPSRRFRG